MNTREQAQMATTERVRSLAAELHANRDYTDPEMDYFELIEDILIEIKGECDPGIVLLNWLRKNGEIDWGRRGKHVYKGDGGDCSICGARLEYWEHC